MRRISLRRSISRKTFQPSIQIRADDLVVYTIYLEAQMENQATLGRDWTAKKLMREMLEAGLTKEEAKRAISLSKAGLFE